VGATICPVTKKGTWDLRKILCAFFIFLIYKPIWWWASPNLLKKIKIGDCDHYFYSCIVLNSKQYLIYAHTITPLPI